jgi:hypothetical protein
MHRVFERARGYRPRLWTARDAGDQILAIFTPVEIATIDWPVARWFSTRAVAYGSVLAQPGPEGQQALDQLLQAYKRDIHRRVIFTELRNLSDLSAVQPVLRKNGLAYEGHLNFLIDLDSPKDEIWDEIRSNAQRNVRKARRSGVEIRVAEDLQGVEVGYGVLSRVYRRIQVPLPDRSLFRAAFEILHPKDMFRLFLAKVDGIDIGAMTLLIHKGVVTYWYTGAPRKYSSYRANDFLVWHALRWSHECGHHTFDFGGGGKPDEEYGVRDFKAKFGGELVNYGRNIGVHSPLRLRASKMGYRVLRRFM